jgi:hypothetical protein
MNLITESPSIDTSIEGGRDRHALLPIFPIFVRAWIKKQAAVQGAAKNPWVSRPSGRQ